MIEIPRGFAETKGLVPKLDEKLSGRLKLKYYFF